MSDLNTTEPKPTNPAPTARKPFWKRGHNLLLASVLVLGGGIAGAVVTGGVYAQGMGPGFGMGHGGPGMGFGPGGFGRQLDPAQIEARADRMVRHLAVEIDATNDQTEKLRTIVKGAVKDLVPLRTQMRDAREKAKALLVQPNLSRSDIETFRAQQLALCRSGLQACHAVARRCVGSAQYRSAQEARRAHRASPGDAWLGTSRSRSRLDTGWTAPLGPCFETAPFGACSA